MGPINCAPNPKAAITKPLNCLQGGFRPQVGCNMSSLMIKECISYAKENHSKLFVCYLDIQKAFDRMWHNGLFVKLYDLEKKIKIARNYHRLAYQYEKLCII